VPAYRECDQWEEQLIISVLNNFWPAVCMGKIVFQIGQKTIDRNNIDSYMDKYKGNADCTAYRYFSAYKNRNGKQFFETIPFAGLSELKLIIDSKRESKPIAVTRKNGMIIDTWGHFSSRKPISGVYICHDENGNEILRNLEPPRHDKWDPKRGENGKAVIDAIRKWIRKCIDEFLDEEIIDSFQISAMAQYLPDDEIFGPANTPPNSPEGFPNGAAEPTAPPIIIGLPPIMTRLPGDEPGITAGENEGTTGGGGTQNSGGNGGDGHPGQGTGDQVGGQGSKGENKTKKRPLQMRCIYDEIHRSYTIMMRAEDGFEGTVSFGAVGDDGEVEPLQIEKAILDGQEIPLANGKKKVFVKIKAGDCNRYTVIFEEKEKMTLRVFS